MSKPNEERDIYYIPPNFLASGRLFGGMIRARNAIEACVLVLLTGIPIIKLPMSLTVRIIILCLLPLPLGIFGIIGFEGDSLSEFAINWVRWFIHRRNLYRSDVTIPETARKQKKRIWEQEATKPPEELGIRIKQPRKKRKRPAKTEKQLNKNNRKMVPSHKKQVTYSEDFVPVKDIRNGIIEMEDGRYIRVLEVEPINFLLRSTSEHMDQYNPQQKLFSLVRSAEVSSVTLRNLTARTVRDDTAPFYCEVADLLGIKVEETHDWLKISVPAILPKRNQRDNQAFLTRPLRYAIMDYLKENPMERFGSCAICIVHNYDAALGKRRIRDYDNIETKRYLDVIESMLLTNDSGLLCTVLQATRMSDRDSAEFYLMRPETLSSWAKNHIKTTTKTCSE